MRVILLGVVLAIAALAPANSFADDKQIAEFIKAKLVQEKQRGNLYGFNVDMRVDRGTVWFKGFVSNRNQELMILRTAQLAGHLGVTQVVDDIEINQPNPQMTAQPLAPQMQQQVGQRQSIMASTQNPYEMQQQQRMAPNFMQPRQMPRRMPQAQPQMPMPQMPRANSPSAPARHSMPMSMPVSKLEKDEKNETQKVAYQQSVESDDAYMSPFANDRPSTPFAAGHGNYKNDVSGPSFQDNLTKTVSATTAVPASNPVAGPPLPFAKAAAAPAGIGCRGGLCGRGCASGCADAGGFSGGGFSGGGLDSGSANLPGYAWPSYAAHPNYGAVSYPKQYSPSAWPYIGPFYPYPQVPLGWRRVALEWDDGWWYLDFYDKNSSR